MFLTLSRYVSVDSFMEKVKAGSKEIVGTALRRKAKGKVKNARCHLGIG